jgi:hypothetical protein
MRDSGRDTLTVPSPQSCESFLGGVYEEIPAYGRGGYTETSPPKILIWGVR